MSEIQTTPAPEFKTSLIKNQNQYLTMIEKQMSDHRIILDTYQKTCVMNAISGIVSVLDKTGVSLSHPDVDQSSITQILLTVAALKLNASATPREIYFQMRNVKKTVRNLKTLDKADEKTVWMKVVEMGIEGDGNDALLRNFGANVKYVGQPWIIRKDDEFTPPKYVGLKAEPPVWKPVGSGNVKAVVYCVLKEGVDGGENIEEYYVAYREEVRSNLMAHISNNMMNECFGICVDRYKATAEQKTKIENKKHEIMEKADSLGLDDILACKDFEAWISPAWREPQSRELMIIRKMRNNIVKKIPKDFKNGYAADRYSDTASEFDGDEAPTKDAGGDDQADAAKLIDITAEQMATIEPVKPPRTHPQPTQEGAQDDSDPFAAAQQAISNSSQISL